MLCNPYKQSKLFCFENMLKRLRAFIFIFFPNHESGNILNENDRNISLAAKLDKMSTFQGGITEQDPCLSVTCSN